MSKIELANRLNNIMLSVNPYEYRNTDTSVETINNDLVNDPYGVVSALMDIIEDLVI